MQSTRRMRGILSTKESFAMFLKSAATSLFIVLVTSAQAFSSGMLIPKEAGLSPLSVSYHRVRTEIRDQAATTTVIQAFRNNTGRVLEATYLFPLPEGASIRDFSMIINGKKVSGELLDKDKARGIYESIVRRLRDPGLLEYASGNVIRARVYPVPARGDQKIELRYTEALSFDAGIVRYRYPLRTGGGSLRTLEDLTFQVLLHSRASIRSIVSPSHKVDIVRKGDHEAAISYEERGGSLNDDFLLYYTVGTKEIALNALTYHPSGVDGYYMMMIAPRVELPHGKVLPKDVTFVIDTSGSMTAADKMGQAKKALAQCIRDLGPEDRFNVVRFSTEAEPFRSDLSPVTKASVASAVRFVEGFRARGGTNIDEALRLGLSHRGKAGRPHILLFLTDGLPTIGETDVSRLLAAARKGRGKETRIFCFGVGYDVNTRLLDTLSSENRGKTRYVKPGEDIEAAVGALWTRISEPVMSHPVVTVNNVKVFDSYPKNLPDVFAGDQLVVYGRYQGGGPTAVKLSGDVLGKKKTIVYETSFARAAKKGDADFIPALWATRKVGYLLEAIRLHGEKPELKQEVIRLSKEYGIMTPYTSYLVTPDEEIERRRRDGRQVPPPPEDMGRGAAVKAPMPSRRAKALRSLGYVEKESGKDAVTASETLAEMKKGDTGFAGAGVRRVHGKVFRFENGGWVMEGYRSQKIHKIRYQSDAYFTLVRVEPEIGRFLSLGEQVTFAWKGVWFKVGRVGKSTMTEAEARRLLSGRH